MLQDEMIVRAMDMSVDKLVEDLSSPKTRNNVVVEKPDYFAETEGSSNTFSFTEKASPEDISYPRDSHFKGPHEWSALVDEHIRAINMFDGQHLILVNHVLCTPIYTDTDPFDTNALNASFDYTIGPVFSTFEPGPDGKISCKPKEGHQTHKFAISDGKFYLGFGVQMDPVVRIGRRLELTPTYLHEKKDGDKDDDVTAFMRAVLQQETGPKDMQDLFLLARNYATLFPSKHVYEAWKHGDIVTVNDGVYPVVLSEESVRRFVNGGKKSASMYVARPIVPSVPVAEAPADVRTDAASWPPVQSEDVSRNYLADAMAYLRRKGETVATNVSRWIGMY
ncbi:MAG TPA: hypothetical protein VJB05_04205 [archaeon]|nr:hypothetical protein [archaeon]